MYIESCYCFDVSAVEAVKSGEWSTWSPMWMCGKGLSNSTVGIVGLGRIGMAISRRIRPFGVEKLQYSGRTKKSYDHEVDAKLVSFDELLNSSDFVIASLPLEPQTKELFNKAAFDKMKKSAIFINISRGGLVNQNDLYDCLKAGRIRAAGLDVTTPEPLPTDHPLLRLKNCVVLPHIGSATVETRSAMAKLTARNILAGLSGLAMPSPLDISV